MVTPINLSVKPTWTFWSKSNRRFSSWWISWIFDRCKRSLLLLLNNLLNLRLSILLLRFRFRFFLFFLIISSPWGVFAHCIVLISLSSLLWILGLSWNGSNFSWVSPSVICTCSIIMSQTEVTGTTWFVMYFNWCLTLVVLWEVHLILFIYYLLLICSI